MMKSNLYQKEGWSILEDDNMFFGFKPENTEDFEEEFSFSKKVSKEEIDKSAQDFAYFMLSASEGVHELSEEEVNCNVEKILEKAFHAEENVKPIKSGKAKKVTIKVLFIAAVLSAVCFCGIYVVGNSNNVSIENGFVTFAKDTIQVAFFSYEEEYISVDALLNSLEEHGYDNILLPEEFVTKSNKYKVSVPVYNSGIFDAFNFEIYNDEVLYSFGIYKNKEQADNLLNKSEDGDTREVNGILMHILEFDSGVSVEFVDGECQYYIASDLSYDDTVAFAETLKYIDDIK